MLNFNDYSMSDYQIKAAIWHEKRAVTFERWSISSEWSAEQRADFALWAEAERRNAEDYRSGRHKITVLDALRGQA